MTFPLAQRELVLAAIALLAAVAALALAAMRDDASGPRPPASVPAPGGGWYTALAASRGQGFANARTACGHRVGPRSMGVAHPVLPCDTKLFVAYGDKEVLTQVLAVGPAVPGRDFELTRALARELGLQGIQQIRWRYAQAEAPR